MLNIHVYPQRITRTGIVLITQTGIALITHTGCTHHTSRLHSYATGSRVARGNIRSKTFIYLFHSFIWTFAVDIHLFVYAQVRMPRLTLTGSYAYVDTDRLTHPGQFTCMLTFTGKRWQDDSYRLILILNIVLYQRHRDYLTVVKEIIRLSVVCL